jgi:hyperosmotically inducible periplasmic protein
MQTRRPGYPRLGIAGILLAALLLGAGCQSYREGTSRTAGELLDDAAIQSRVKLALLNDPEIKGLRINTEVKRGVVMLQGRVASREQQQRAVSLAGAIKGVVEVDDRLSVVTE